MSLPAGIKVEIEFVTGTWTDVTASVLMSSGISTKCGRTSPQSAPQRASFGCTLDNPTGAFTPGVAVLSTGAANPYYPNVTRRKRIRYSYLVGSTRYYRFTGQISSWVPAMQGGFRPIVAITATDRGNLLSRVDLRGGILDELIHDGGAFNVWPLTEPAGAVAAGDIIGGLTLSLHGSDGAPAPTFGAGGPGAGDGTACLFAPSGQTTGGVLRWGQLSTNVANIEFLSGATLEAWINPATSLPAWTQNIATAGSITLQLLPSGVAQARGLTGGPSLADGDWHHVAVTIGGLLSGLGTTLYVDGVAVATSGGQSLIAVGMVTVGDCLPGSTSPAPGRYAGQVGYLALSPPLSAAQIAAHSQATTGFRGETSGARVARFLSYGGVAPADMNVDPGVAVLESYGQAGKSITDAIQDVATSEGGGAAFYITTDGLARFCDRNFRAPGPPVATFDAIGDFDGSKFTSADDDSLLVNQVTVNRSAESGTLSTQIASAASSITADGLSTASVTTYTISDRDALSLAQSLLTDTSGVSAVRFPQLPIDAFTSTNALIYQLIAQLVIGSRVRAVNLPPQTGPSTQRDLMIEGWTETLTTSSYSVVYDASAADAPRPAVWGSSRWGASSSTVSDADGISATATTLHVATATLPLWTTSAGDVPFEISIDAEVMTVTAISGTASPQQFTITRGAEGTTPAPHAHGATVQVYPAPTWSL